MRTIVPGEQFGRLTVIGAPARKDGKNQVATKCVCGVEKVRIVKLLIEGRVKSCGCLKKEVSALLNRFDADGALAYPAVAEYKSWCNLNQATRNGKSVAFTNVGARGIRLCSAWQEFPAFFKDMGICPPGHSLTRIDTEKDFSKENCRWAVNKRGRTYFFQGRNRTAATVAATLGVSIQDFLVKIEAGEPLGVTA